MINANAKLPARILAPVFALLFVAGCSNSNQMPTDANAVVAKASVLATRPQTPQAPFDYQVEEVTFKNSAANVSLAGTLSMPNKGKVKGVAILISGAGPHDRDETILDHKPFLVIADHLSEQGIAVLRFDDRGTGQSSGDFTTATNADFASDVQAAYDYLQSRDDLPTKKIGLIGHSEGGIVAQIVAAKNHDIAFMIMLAAPTIKGPDLLAQQAFEIEARSGGNPLVLIDRKRQERYLYQQIAKGASEADIAKGYESIYNSDQETAKAAAVKLSSPWMRSFLAFDAKDHLPKVTAPILALNGSKDLQVQADTNTQRIKKLLSEANHPNYTVTVLNKHNHLFQEARSGLPKEYGTIEQTISPLTLSTISEWLANNL